MLYRKKYMDKIIRHIEHENIKVLTGLRRSGKSTLLHLTREYLLNEMKISKENILYINFESLMYNQYRDHIKLYNFILDYFVESNSKVYILFDEIQLVRKFEEVINSLRVDIDCSIFLTGSNSDLMSSEIATLLTGRYTTINVNTFSFSEYREYYKNSTLSDEELLADYLINGGFPSLLTTTDQLAKSEILTDILSTIIYKDIVSRYNIRDVMLLEKLIEYSILNTSKEFSLKSLTNYLNSNGYKVGNDTIYNYLSYIENVFIISECRIYDIKGKKILKRNSKRYLRDLGLINNIKNNNYINFSICYETLVYNQLIYMGYEVYTGKNSTYEIDFVAIKNSITTYIQVAYKIESEETLEREIRSLKNIDSNDRKLLITSENIISNEYGIEFINIIEFLLE